MAPTLVALFGRLVPFSGVIVGTIKGKGKE